MKCCITATSSLTGIHNNHDIQLLMQRGEHRGIRRKLKYIGKCNLTLKLPQPNALGYVACSYKVSVSLRVKISKQYCTCYRSGTFKQGY